MTVLTISFR